MYSAGLIQVWILLLEQLTAAVSNCPRQHQPPTLELLFELLREVTKTPGKGQQETTATRPTNLMLSSLKNHSHVYCFLAGPGFAIFSVIQLLLPVMSLWLQRSHGDYSYWDIAAANFKHAIGLSCELVVEHVQSFIHSGRSIAAFRWPAMFWLYCVHRKALLLIMHSPLIDNVFRTEFVFFDTKASTQINSWKASKDLGARIWDVWDHWRVSWMLKCCPVQTDTSINL